MRCGIGISMLTLIVQSYVDLNKVMFTSEGEVYVSFNRIHVNNIIIIKF